MFSPFTGSDFHVESFPGDMSFGELSLIKSQSHLRSHIRIDQFSYSWNCSWPLLPWALIQNQQHGHRGLKQRNWVRLQEASKSTEGKYPIKQCQLAISRVSLSFLMSWWVTYSFEYTISVNDKGGVLWSWLIQLAAHGPDITLLNFYFYGPQECVWYDN